MRVVLGVGAGIAAYKVAYVLRGLTEQGHQVQVVPTADSLRFVGAATWEALSGQPVHTSVFDDVLGVEHVQAGAAAELVIVAPATADLLARLAHGHANDLLTATLLMATCPVLVVPAMHTQMWNHPATAANVATLRSRGLHVLEPASGRLTGTDTGIGRLPEPDQILAAARPYLQPAPADLAGTTVLISAGGTREAIDPVRYLSNRSSGRQGWALARQACRRGAKVHLVAANVSAAPPAGVQVTAVESAAQLHEAMLAGAASAQIVIMAAAVADYRPVAAATHKIKKTGAGLALELEPTPDVLAALVANRRPGQLIVGFGAETGDDAATWLEHGRAKACRKQADLLVVNPVGAHTGFGDVATQVHLFDSTGRERAQAHGSKDEVAAIIFDEIVTLRAGASA